jgi:taurine dioxygenase
VFLVANVLRIPQPSLETGPITVRPLQPTIGAEIEGVDLRNPISAEVRDAIRAALLKHKVIFFRDQELTREQHIAFGRQFGDLEQHPFIRLPDYPEIQPVYSDAASGRADRWHTDTSWRLTPSLGAILRAIEVPDVGGDTLWADAVAVYNSLPDDVKTRIEGLYAIHDSANLARLTSDPEKVVQLRRSNPLVAHPIVRRHPETGERSLFLNSTLTTQILYFDSKRESDDLLEYLFARFHAPEHQVRFKWRKHSIAFWDNRQTVHYASNDYGEFPRRMERVAIVGDRPVP